MAAKNHMLYANSYFQSFGVSNIFCLIFKDILIRFYINGVKIFLIILILGIFFIYLVMQPENFTNTKIADYCGIILSPKSKTSKERINVFMRRAPGCSRL